MKKNLLILILSTFVLSSCANHKHKAMNENCKADTIGTCACAHHNDRKMKNHNCDKNNPKSCKIDNINQNNTNS